MSDKKKYKIAVNTRLLLDSKLEGIGWYKYHILKNWVEKHPESTFYFLFDRKYDTKFIFGKNVIPVVIPPQSRHPLLWYIWFEISIKIWVKKNNPDILVSMENYTSISSKCVKFTTIHDIAYEFFDKQISWLKEKYMRYFTVKYAKSSDIIATVSYSTKNDIVSKYNIAEEKVVVAYNAPSGNFLPKDDKFKANFKKNNTGGNDFFLYVGSIHPRKNVKKLLEAFEAFKAQNDGNHILVIIGRKAWQYDDVSTYLNNMKYKSHVKMIAHSHPKKIADWMASASALVLVSKYEGFGIPIVEAMACHTPIICSNISSMPEVAGNTAIKVSPENTEEIKNAMRDILKDEVRESLISEAKNRIKLFSWDSSSDFLWEKMTSIL